MSGTRSSTKVLSTQILRFHRLMTSIGRAFPAAGRLFYDTGPRTAYQIIAEWIASHQKAETSVTTKIRIALRSRFTTC